MPTRLPPLLHLLRELLSYDAATGMLTWKPRTGKRAERWNKRREWQPAGTVRAGGSVVIKVHDQNILAHRAIFAMQVGKWPGRVWHINECRADNRKKNLMGTLRWERLGRR